MKPVLQEEQTITTLYRVHLLPNVKWQPALTNEARPSTTLLKIASDLLAYILLAGNLAPSPASDWTVAAPKSGGGWRREDNSVRRAALVTSMVLES